MLFLKLTFITRMNTNCLSDSYLAIFFLNEHLVSSLEANNKKSLGPLSTQTFTVPVKVDVDATLQSPTILCSVALLIMNLMVI